MTTAEYKSALESLSDERFAAFRKDFGGDFRTRQQYVDDFIYHPEHERRICQLLGLTTELDKLSEAARASALAAADSAHSARWSMIWAGLSLLVALCALFFAAYR